MVINNNIGVQDKYSALESFRSKHAENPQPAAAVTKPAEDKVEISTKTEEAKTETKPQKEKTSLFQKFKNCYANVKKAFITAGEYTVATAKGLLYGGVGALCTLGADAVINAVKKNGKGFSLKGKIAAGAIAVGAMGYQWFQAHLNSNQRSADVDHRWGTGHNKQL